MTQRRDMHSECNFLNEQMQTFEAVWCKRCTNQECTRSLSGLSLFEARVSTWEERLFKNPVRMPLDDPRYKTLAAQRFITLDTERLPDMHTSDWMDPTELVEPAPSAKVEPVLSVVQEPLPAPIIEVPKVEVPPPVEVVPVEVEHTPPPIEKRPPSNFSFMNTQSQSGRMLSGVDKKQEVAPKRDAWDVPEPVENLVPLGAKIKLGGG